jgi:hypothetical protein
MAYVLKISRASPYMRPEENPEKIAVNDIRRLTAPTDAAVPGRKFIVRLQWVIGILAVQKCATNLPEGLSTCASILSNARR